MPLGDAENTRSFLDVVEEVGVYPVEAYDFVQQGLSHTVRRIHGHVTDPDANRHVSGQQLSEGLRDFALERWGLLAEAVLARWNITSTMDFGRIVFALVSNGFLSKTEGDRIEDFRNVYDFKTAFEQHYKIASRHEG
jgi:uncharacterized repeat protein (TIGR04138 family)